MKRLIGMLMAFVLCFSLLPGTALAVDEPKNTETRTTHTTRTQQLKLTNQDAENAAEGWSWKKTDEDGYYYTLTLDNVNFEVPDDSAITFSMDKQVWLDTITVVLIGENRVVSTHQTENIYDGCGILLDTSSSRTPLEIVVSGSGSLSVEGWRCGISLGTDELHFNGVTVRANAHYPSGLLVTNRGSLLLENSEVYANTISAAELTSNNSDISVNLNSLPDTWTYAVSLIAADSVDISGGSLTLAGSEEKPAYDAIFNNNQTSIDLSNCQIDIRDVQYGLNVNAGTINLTNVSGTVFCTESGALLTSGNPAFHANEVNATDCSIYAQTGSDILTYGDCSLPSEISELIVPGDLKIETDKTFTIGMGQKITFSKNPAQICQYIDNTTLINNGTLEFLNMPTFRSGTKLINNGTLIAPKGISYSKTPGVPQNAQVTNHGIFNGIVTENSGFTRYIYGNVTLEGNIILGVLNGSKWMINKTFVMSDAVLTIPNEKTLDASKEENGLKWDSLSDYLTVGEGGKIVVEEGGTLLLPPNPTKEQLNSLPITGDGIVKFGDAILCTITFDSQGGSDVEEQPVLSGQTAEQPTDPTRENYTFAGWYTDATCTTAYNFETPVTENITLYAKWELVERTVTFDAQEGSTVDAQTVAHNTAATKPADPTREGYTFGGWYTDAACTTAYDFETPVTADLTLYAKWNRNTSGGNSGGSGGGTTTPSAPVNTTTPSGGSGSETTASPNASTKGDTASSTVSNAVAGEIVKQAEENKSETVIIAPVVQGDVNKTEVTVPASALGELGSKTDASVTISTPVAQVSIPNSGLGQLASGGGTVTVSAEKVGNRVELSVTAGGSAVTDLPGGVTLTVPHDDCKPGTVAVLVKEDGTREVIRKSAADDGELTVTIPLNGSAKLEIVDNSKTFQDVQPTDWCADAAAFASGHDLFQGTGADTFSPNVPMTRGMLATVLHNLESNPRHDVSAAFSDLSGTEWYAPGVSWAAAQGIVTGYENGTFGGNDPITREQLAVMLWRYAGKPAPGGGSLAFPDAGQAGDYALEALRWAVETGVFRGNADGTLNPKGQATRAQAAQMLMNFLLK